MFFFVSEESWDTFLPNRQCALWIATKCSELILIIFFTSAEALKERSRKTSLELCISSEFLARMHLMLFSKKYTYSSNWKKNDSNFVFAILSDEWSTVSLVASVKQTLWFEKWHPDTRVTVRNVFKMQPVFASRLHC